MEKRFSSILAALGTVFVLGTAGYVLIEGWGFSDALYMTVITLFSVGYGEVNPLSATGRTFTIFLIICGSGVLIYGVSLFTAFIVEGDLTGIIRRRRMQREIHKLDRHYVMCGVSATGKYLLEELLRTGRSVVVIEKDAAKTRELAERGIPYLEADATQEAVLQEAGICRAEGLVTSLHSDADNLFVVVTARGLNSTLRIVSKAIDEESEKKLKQVGADRVVMPNYIGGLRMASEMVRPSVVDFLDVMLRSRDVTIRIEEVTIAPDSPLVGKTLENSGLLDVEGATVVAVKGGAGKGYTFNPSRSLRLAGGEVFIVMGIVETIGSLQRHADGASPAGACYQG